MRSIILFLCKELTYLVYMCLGIYAHYLKL